MSKTGRYWIVVNGRRFCVEPLHERDQKENDVAFRNGGLDGKQVKNEARGGSISPEDSTITKENGFKRILVLPPGVSPEDGIRQLLESE